MQLVQEAAGLPAAVPGTDRKQENTGGKWVWNKKFCLKLIML